MLTATALRMGLMPMVAWLAGTLCGLDGAHLLGVVMTVALPSAQNIFLHTTRYRVGEDVARETVLIRPSSACRGAARRAAIRLIPQGATMPLPARLHDSLGELLGPSGLLTEPDDVAPYLVDWTGIWRGAAPAVLRPASTDEVSRAVALCHEAGTALVPQGGNTGLTGGGVPDASGDTLVLSTDRLHAVRDVDPVANTITVEAGVVLADVQAAAARVGRLFPLSLGSEGSCTIGGNLATNAGGTGVLRYGMARNLVLGLEVVLPDGRVWDGLRPLRKDNTGYDLTGLFVGSEGTLGVITAAVLTLAPAVPRKATAWIALPSPSAAVALFTLVREHAAERLSAFELVGRDALELVLGHLPGAHDPFNVPHPWYALMELAAAEPVRDLDESLEVALSDAFEHDLVADAVVAGSPAQRARLWALREGISEAQKIEGTSIKHDVSLPIAELARFVATTGPRLAKELPAVRLVTYGHVGDGNLHYNLSALPGNDHSLRSAAHRLTGMVYDAVDAAGGSISAEHGLGRSKVAAAAQYKSEVELQLMRAVKRAFDPQGLMNPGAMLPR
jgi:FAD/FMN-containing dehydrogenase